jgi:hypothetical protein
MSTTSEVTYETAMPFVLCRSHGGPYDDDAFLSGWRLGGIATTLAGPGVSAVSDSIRVEERRQADLIAMACGYAMTVDGAGDAGWLNVTFSLADD